MKGKRKFQHSYTLLTVTQSRARSTFSRPGARRVSTRGWPLGCAARPCDVMERRDFRSRWSQSRRTEDPRCRLGGQVRCSPPRLGWLCSGGWAGWHVESRALPSGSSQSPCCPGPDGPQRSKKRCCDGWGLRNHFGCWPGGHPTVRGGVPFYLWLRPAGRGLWRTPLGSWEQDVRILSGKKWLGGASVDWGLQRSELYR